MVYTDDPYIVMEPYFSTGLFHNANKEGYDSVAVANGMTRQGTNISALFDFHKTADDKHKIVIPKRYNGPDSWQETGPIGKLSYRHFMIDIGLIPCDPINLEEVIRLLEGQK